MSTPKKLQNGQTAQDALLRERSEMHLKCSYQRHAVNIPWSKGSPVFPPEQHWVRARGFSGSRWRMWPTQPIWLQPARVSSLNIPGDPQGGHLFSAASGKGSWAPPCSSGNPKHSRAQLGLTRARWNGAPGKPKGVLQWKNTIIRVDKNMEVISFLQCAWINTIQIQESLNLRSPHCKLNFSINMSLISPHECTWRCFFTLMQMVCQYFYHLWNIS